MKKFVEFLKKETVLSIATVLAIISAFWVHPSKEYLGYIDWRTLGILLSLMIIMEGFKRTGLFDKIGETLLKYTGKLWQLVSVLIMLCFFLSMFITNDVALLTFVPFSVMVLEGCNRRDALIPTIILQTIAANLGSMLTPLGNPQNLYLFSIMQCSIVEFIEILLPYTTLTLLLLIISVFFIKGKSEVIGYTTEAKEEENETEELVSVKTKNIIYGILFVIALLVVARLLDYLILVMLVVVAVMIFDKKTLVSVDYALIFTFISFFVLIGNLGNITAIQSALSIAVSGREVYVGVAASQFISNVPATLLLSGFTEDFRSLLIGVNLGGLGTMIASMASLISYKIYAHRYNDTKGKYLLWFSVVNVIYLAILLLAYWVIG